MFRVVKVHERVSDALGRQNNLMPRASQFAISIRAQKVTNIAYQVQTAIIGNFHIVKLFFVEHFEAGFVGPYKRH